MRQRYAITLLFLFSFVAFTKAQVVTVTNPTNTTPNLAATYTSLNNAIAALNAITIISGPVTITLNPGNPETAPAGGYAINFATINNNTIPVIIAGSNNTITAFTPQVTGTVTDAVFKIIGSDNITIQDFTIQENPSNSTTGGASPNNLTTGNNMTEWGIALFYKSATDGAQNNIIKNNTISLNKIYGNNFGIYSNTRHTAIAGTVTAEITNISGSNAGNKVYGNGISNVNMGIAFIGSGNAGFMDLGNDIGGGSTTTGNTITNWGGLTQTSNYIGSSGSCYGIFVNNQKDENVSYNTISSATVSGTAITMRGVFKAFSNVPTGTFTSTISNNIITISNNNFSGMLDGIRNEGISSPIPTASININSNSFLNISAGAVSNAINIVGISNTSQAGILNINANIFRGTISAATSGGFTAISNTGAVQTTLNINNNKIGDALGDAVNFSAATIANLNGIACITVAPAASVSISNNNFQGFVNAVTGSGLHIYINLTHAASTASTDNINNNTFTNLSPNTSGDVYFINRSGAMALAAGATENCKDNSIITAFSKPTTGGVVYLYSGITGSLSGNSMVQTGNNFSNITIISGTTMSGWNNGEGGTTGPSKTISNNIFNNWSCGTSGVAVIQSDKGGDNTTVSGNDIQNIAGAGFVTAITQGSTNKGTTQTISNNIIASVSSSGNTVLGITGGAATTTTLNITGNNINTLSSSGPNTTEAIRITASGATTNLIKNKIYDISGLNATCLLHGININPATSAATYNIINNFIGNLTASITSSTFAIRGISVGPTTTNTTFNLLYNTVYINASSSGTDFGTAALFLIANSTATTNNGIIRNNILINTSTASGSGLTVSYRRSGTTLPNYNTTSNNNIFYAGVPSATNVIYFDGTNSDQTLAAFKTRVGPTRESASFTELPTFLSTTGASINFLHLNPAIQTQAESGAVNIAGYTDDFDGDIRQGNGGYTGSGSAPDIGADEIEAGLPVISFTPITSPSCIFSGMTITGVIITDATGIPLSGANRPRIYYKKNAGAWFSQPGTNTGGTATNSTWSFTIVETDMGSLSGGDVISYYIIAQDLDGTANLGSNASIGLIATSVNSVSTAPTSPNTYTLSYNLSGTYTVGIGGNFTTISAAVNAYNNACSLAGPAVFELIDNSYPSETFPIAILLHADASSTNTLTIRPSSTATPIITGISANPILNLNGAKYINVDGRQGGIGSTRSLTISNTGTGITIQFINDAQNNILKYNIIKGQRVSSFSGTIVFGAANASGTGNDNNTIDHNEINEAGGFSNNAIYSSGTAFRGNDNMVITNNNISNYFNAGNDSHGIYITTANSGTSWIITGNRLFQTGTRVYTAANIHFGIYATAGSGYTISNNVIGFANESGTGTTNMIGNSVTLAGFPASYSASGTPVALRYIAIAGDFDLGGATSTIDGNSIGGIAMYTSSTASTLSGMLCGIYIESGTVNIGAIAGNTIGAITGNNSIYVATSGIGGTIVGIRAANFLTSTIQNNQIGSITSSGTSAAVSGNFTGMSIAGFSNYAVSNNSIGNADANNIRVGYFLSGGLLSNSGSLTATNVGVTSNVKAITSTSTGNLLTITNNTLRGWVTSCRSTFFTGIESSGAMTGSNPAININNNFFATSATNWLNASVDVDAVIYCVNVSNTVATIYNIKDNDIQGTLLGAQTGVGGTLVRLVGATSPNAIATISGNSFTNISMKFSTGTLFLISANYFMASTGQLYIDNNRIVGTFNTSGTASYRMIQCIMGSSAGALAFVTNNNFSNFIAAPGFSADFLALFCSFAFNPCQLSITGNIFNNCSFGTGSVTGIDISDMAGSVNCSNNQITNITSLKDIEGITVDPASSSGLFNVTNNSISGLVSTGSGGYINGVTISIPASLSTAQINISNNTINSFSSAAPTGILAGIYIRNGHSSGNVSILSNKIYDLSESGNLGYVYGIFNSPTTTGNITYSNNYIGDLRAPLSNVVDQSIVGIKLFLLGGQSNVYYNTIHLNASGSPASFSTAALFADAGSAVNLRNNIFSNVSTPGSTGKTVAYWRSGTSLLNYNATSNNNLFYAGVASSKNLIFFDGTNSDQMLSTYQTRVTPSDNLSVNILPSFISTVGSNVNFLHIFSSGSCDINAKGNNAGILLATDYDGEPRSTTSPFVTDIGADEFSIKNAWTGTNSTAWNDAGNWSEAVVPNSDEENVVISSGPSNQPIIGVGETFQVASLIISSGATLTNRGSIKISGVVYSIASGINNIQAGTIEGSVEMNGNCSLVQQLAGNVFVGNSVKNFTISTNVDISTAAGEELNISRALSFGVTGKTLNTGNNIVLLSTETATANVADVTGNTISGSVTVERYINTGTGGARHPKSWQFLATPTQGQTIFESWQENGPATAGYGTIITGTGTGFDITTSQPSMKYFDPSIGANGNWVGISSTLGQLNDKRGYMLFVRGDRTVVTFNAPPTPTKIRSKGTLYQPTAPAPVTNVFAGKLAAVGNPFASAVNVDYMKNNGLFVNLNNDVVVWDPLLYGSYGYGGYQTLAAANNYEPTAGGTSYYPAAVPSPNIQSGQAFFVKSSGLAGTVTFTEACKDGGNRLVNKSEFPATSQYFRARLFTNTGMIADGNSVVFNFNYRNGIDADDAAKFLNAGENFSIASENKLLSVEARKRINRNDTIFYTISNLKKQPYQLRFAPKNMQFTGLNAFLIDKYLNTTTQVSLNDSSFVNIEINDDARSFAADRFFVVFKKRSRLPINNTTIVTDTRKGGITNEPKIGVQKKPSIIAYPNPVENKKLQLRFVDQPVGNYQIQLLNNLGQPVFSKNIMINNSNSIQWFELNEQIPTGNYFVHVTASDGKKTVIKLLIK